MKRLGIFVLPPGWDANPSQGNPPHFIFWYCENTRPQHNVLSGQGSTGDKRTDHEADVAHAWVRVVKELLLVTGVWTT